MNIKSRIAHLANLTDRDLDVARYDFSIKQAKEMQATVLTHSIDYAQRLQRKFGVVAKSIEVNLDGLAGPFVWDAYGIKAILMKAFNKIETLEAEIEVLKKQVQDYKDNEGNERC